MNVGFITHPDCRLHTLEGHPENAARTDAIEIYFRESSLINDLHATLATPATREQVLLNHDAEYVDKILGLRPKGIQLLDADTYVNEYSTQAALLSYGGALQAVDRVMDGEWNRAFCVLRPPGHHAEFDHQMGFCIFNNIAGAARYAIKKYSLERVAIIDFDVHHGNGTQWSFYEECEVHFTSLHQWPFYPGTGAAGETGRGAGKGYNLNFPLFAGTTGKSAIAQLKDQFIPAMQSYKPELMLVSAGFDAHREDPLATLNFEDEDFYEITTLIAGVANQFCSGRIVSLLEGGYNLPALARSAYQHVKGLFTDD